MTRTVVVLVAIALLLIGQGPARAVPLEEIRQLLRHNALVVPDESVLAALTEDNLADALLLIDPYARLFTAADYRSPMLGPASWIGIGADLAVSNGEIFLAVYAGGAAALAGLPDRSKLVAIDGQSTAGVAVATVANRLKGAEGTVVTLLVEWADGRRGQFAVERRAFTALAVEPVLSGSHRVLRIREFVGGVTRSALLATLDFLARKGTNPAEPLIIDLRDAGGGDLYEAFDLAGVFLPAGTLLGTVSGPAGVRRELRSPAGVKIDRPLALLVGPDTASAAEVFAGSLQQHGRARLVGRRTYGKCSSQTDAHLSDGSVLRYTNREVLLPDGSSCSGAGLTPDREVMVTEPMDLLSLVGLVQGVLAGK